MVKEDEAESWILCDKNTLVLLANLEKTSIDILILKNKHSGYKVRLGGFWVGLVGERFMLNCVAVIWSECCGRSAEWQNGREKLKLDCCCCGLIVWWSYDGENKQN